MNERRSRQAGRRCLLLLGLVAAFASCDRRRPLPGRPSLEDEAVDPREVVSFETLYGSNCAGCHGIRGEGGASIGLASRGFLAIASDPVIRNVIANGRPGTAMPAFARSAGGLLSDAQVDALVKGIRAWAPAGTKPDPETPPYQATAPGDPRRGAAVFQKECASCHGADGRGGQGAGSIVDGAFLALVSDQSLRTTIIAGRPDLGSPDWRGIKGTPMTAQDVSDTVAWLAAQRQPFPGQPYPSAQAMVKQQ
jgi:cytochrome c oxidase cbb3-type subunit III